MIHVTCAKHGLHWTSLELCGHFSTINKVVSNVKHFLKSAISYTTHKHIMFLQ